MKRVYNAVVTKQKGEHMKKLLLNMALVAVTIQSLQAEAVWSLEAKWIDLSKAGLEKSTPAYGIDYSYDFDIGASGAFHLYGDFTLLFGKSDVKGSTKSINYTEFSVGLGPMYKFQNGVGLYAIPRVGYVGFGDSWGSNTATDGYLIEGTVGATYNYKRINLNLFASFGKRWIDVFDYSSNSYGFKIGWSF